MKKLLLLTSLLVFGITIGTAQENWSYGIKGGINLAYLQAGDIEVPDARTSLYGGIMAEIPFKENFSIQPEILYSGQGAEGEDFSGKEYTLRLDYIQVPVLAKIYLSENFDFQIGPTFSFLVDEYLAYDLPRTNLDLPTSEANTFDFGAAAGLEYKLGDGVVAQVRYNYGITEVYEGSDANNSVLQFGLGFMF